MTKVTMIGCDLHDRSMLLRYSNGNGQVQQLSYDNGAAGRRRMIERLAQSAGNSNPVGLSLPMKHRDSATACAINSTMLASSAMS